MILGTHNSLSYAKPLKWWMKPFNFMAKCQSLTVQEQWDFGVRFFDIRTKLINTDYASHGLVDYDISVYKTINWLIDKAEETGETIYIYINCERNLKDGDIDAFEQYLEIINPYKPNVHVCGGYCKGPWRNVLHIKNPSIAELHWEFMNFNNKNYKFCTKLKKLLTNIIHFSPKYWAKKDNKSYKEQAKNSNCEVLMLDFVEL